MEFLASDQLKGRKVFTPEIDKAAGYIASRFKQVGLKTFKTSYKQNFSIFSITPMLSKLSLNGVDIPDEKIAVATPARNFIWDKESEVNKHVIGENDDLSAALAKINLAGGEHLVVVHHKHEKLFNRYKKN